MIDVAIRVENLSKQYRIGSLKAHYKTFRESLTEVMQSPFRRLSSVVRGQSTVISDETIWALRDVSFEVRPGEVVGIIGRNGAGKTTLLKILSRITYPTEGQAVIYGRVGSLLEVGTGFHPELTGRENIYLNGAILGMRKAEIDRKFDAIVNFAEIERFIDTPAKYYSSGMYVRLAFAVAAHLEPEILLVDEVLSVGDAAFQKKCMGRMGEISKEGRTILFVSHDLNAMERLCPRALLIENGHLSLSGPSPEVIGKYREQLRESLKSSGVQDDSTGCRMRLYTRDVSGKETSDWPPQEKIVLDVVVEGDPIPDNTAVDVSFYGPNRVRLFYLTSDTLSSSPIAQRQSAAFRFIVENPGIVVPEISIDVGLRFGWVRSYHILITEATTIHVPQALLNVESRYDCLLSPPATGQWL